MQVGTGVVTTKGQVVIPAKLRTKYGIRPGTVIIFSEHQGLIVMRPITDDLLEKITKSPAEEPGPEIAKRPRREKKP